MTDELAVGLSDAARQRMRLLLPGLLAAVRARRWQRRAARFAVAAGAAALAVALLWRSRRAEPPRVGEALPVAATSWQIVTSAPDVLARCAVPTTRHAEWFIDDQELQDLLAADGRPAGLVRIAGRVEVSAAAIDDLDAPWHQRP